MSALAALCRLRPVVLALAAGSLLSLATCASAAADERSAAAPGRTADAERVLKDDVALAPGRGGVIRVKETIVYQFAGHSALQRTFPTRSHESITQDRVYAIGALRATSPDGGPTSV